MGVVVAFSSMLLRRTPPSVLAALGQSRQQPAQRNPQLLTFAFACPALLTTPSSPLRCPSPHHLGVLTDSVFPQTVHINQNLGTCW